MPANLSLGSVGPLVKQLQEGLNQLASQLPKLASDGQFGPKTRSRVQELQTRNQLVSDGIVGPLTWELLARLLQQVAQGGVPTMTEMTSSTFETLRPLVLLIAQRHTGQVDFGQMVNGRPRGIDFVKEVFDFAANIQLSDANFREMATGRWIATPWVGNTSHLKSGAASLPSTATARPAFPCAGISGVAVRSARSSCEPSAQASRPV